MAIKIRRQNERFLMLAEALLLYNPFENSKCKQVIKISKYSKFIIKSLSFGCNVVNKILGKKILKLNIYAIVKRGDMPKKIKNPKETILATSEALFLNNPFEKVDIRKIAKISKLSSGTVYTYFKSKREILNTILEKKFLEIYISITDEIEKEKDTVKKIEIFIEEFYKEMEHISYLLLNVIYVKMNEHILSKDFSNHEPSKQLEYFKILFNMLLKNAHKESFDLIDSNRLFMSMRQLSVTLSFSRRDSEENIQYLKDFIFGYINQRIKTIKKMGE